MVRHNLKKGPPGNTSADAHTHSGPINTRKVEVTETPGAPTAPGPRGIGSARLLSLGALASGMLRDFNNVMCAVMGFAQLLHQALQQDGADASPAAGYARQILRAGAYGQTLSERLLTYAEGQGGGTAAVDIRGIVDQAFDLVQHLIGGHVRYSRSHTSLPLIVVAAPHELEYVVIALLLGARDAMPDGGHLRLETRYIEDAADEALPTGGGWACIAVHDTGIAPAADADGMALVRTLVSQYGGEVRTAGAADSGNVFEVFLPLNAVA